MACASVFNEDIGNKKERNILPDFENMRLLFVDDQTETIQNYIEYLKRYCFVVDTACDGIEAYKKYHEFKPDIILLDINMPKMDGIEVLKRIRKNDKKTRIIMFTAHNEDEFTKKALDLGTTAYLHKPVKRESLKVALEKAKNELKSLI